MFTFLKNKLLWRKISATPLVKGDPTNFTLHKRIKKVKPDWSTAKITETINDYKKFLYLAATSSDACTPSADVDVVWHEHILFTRDYFETWSGVLGKVIHHDPAKVDETEEDFKEQYKKTEAKKIVEFPKKEIHSKPSLKGRSGVSSSSRSDKLEVVTEVVDNSLNNMIMFGVLSHNHNNDCPPPSDSGHSHSSDCGGHSHSSDSSSSSSSSSSCSSSSSSSCSSGSSSSCGSSCGGGGGD